MQQNPAEKKLWGSKVEIFAFCMGISVHGDFGGMNSQEVVGIKAREWLQ